MKTPIDVANSIVAAVYAIQGLSLRVKTLEAEPLDGEEDEAGGSGRTKRENAKSNI